MVVISNSSPIIHLAKIGRLNLLERLYSRILVPEKVYLECTDTVHYHKEVELIAAQSAWIKRHLIEDDRLFNLLYAEIDAGEAEALVLALEQKADLLLLAEVSSQLSGLIHRKSEGNPLYMEELIRTLISHDLLEKNPVTGQHTVKPLSGKIQIPDTLRGLVASSVDRLDGRIKDVLKNASVIGRSFLYRLLKIIEGRSDLLDDHLSVLVNENLIKEKCADPELEYYFYHQ